MYRFYWVGLLVVILYSPLFASDQQSTVFFRDAKNYLQSIENAKEAKLHEQIEIWKNFLIQYPDTYFRQEIESNLTQLEKILGLESAPSAELSDTEVFFKAKNYIIKNNLTMQDQILLWRQFLSDHPKNVHNNEVKGMISDLQFSLQKKR